MSATRFTGPLVSGDLNSGDPNGPNTGYAMLEQQIAIPNVGAGTFDYAIEIPAGAVIMDFLVDVLTEFNNATSATLQIGNAVGGSQYLAATDIHAGTAGRQALVYTAAELAAMAGLTVGGASSPTLPLVNARVVAVGAGVAGFVNITVRYAQQQLNALGVPVPPANATN